MLTWPWCRNQFRCYSRDSASLWLSRVFLFRITFLTLFFPKLSSQTEWCLCLKATSIDPHWKEDTTAWAFNTLSFIWEGHVCFYIYGHATQKVLLWVYCSQCHIRADAFLPCFMTMNPHTIWLLHNILHNKPLWTWFHNNNAWWLSDTSPEKTQMIKNLCWSSGMHCPHDFLAFGDLLGRQSWQTTG